MILTKALPMATTDTDRQKYTKNLAPRELSGSKNEFSSWKMTCRVVKEFNLQHYEHFSVNANFKSIDPYRNMQRRTMNPGMNT